jgi:hypothetical protein
VIISASVRTDIPAFYADWFLRRLRAGWCEAVNPYNRQARRVSLRPPDVDGYVFWTKNLKPFREALQAVDEAGVPFVVQYTINDYPRLVEPSVPPAARTVADALWLSRTFGPARLVWRYDPIVFMPARDGPDHVRRFAALARALAGATDEVVVSVVHLYAKSHRRLEALRRRHAGFAYRVPIADEARTLLGELAAVARGYGMALRVCAQPDLLPPGATPARCIDPDRLTRVAGRPVAAPSGGLRPACRCAQAVDIGWYDTCPHGCVYCYAVGDARRAKASFRRHDPERASLVPPDDPP